MRIQNNIMAMNAYRNYSNNTSALSQNLEKLSSGYKINRAGDDAAGLAISEKMRAQIAGLEQAQDNAAAGKNLVNTAEGALQEVHDMLNRMVTLANQSANGTFDDDVDRAALEAEVNELKDEINRIADSANYNGINLLDGSMDAEGTIGGGAVNLGTALQVTGGTEAVAATAPKFSVSLDGITVTNSSSNNAKPAITITVGEGTKAQNITLNAAASVAGGATVSNWTLGANSVTIDNIKYDVSIIGGALVFEAASTASYADGYNPSFSVSVAAGTDATLTGSINKGTQVISVGVTEKTASLGQGTLQLNANHIQNGTKITIGDQTFTINFNAAYNASNTTGEIGVKDLLDASGKFDTSKLDDVASRITEVSGNGAFDANTAFSIGHAGGNKLTFQVLSTYNNNAGALGDLSQKANIEKAIKVETPLVHGKSLELQIGDTSDSFNQLALNIKDIHTNSLNLDAITIANQDSAQAAVDVIKNAINTVSTIRAELGAKSNRLDHTMNNLSVMQENIAEAESTIRDTDVAEEMMAYTKNNILVQSAQAMLAQANQVPQGVLQLLQ